MKHWIVITACLAACGGRTIGSHNDQADGQVGIDAAPGPDSGESPSCAAQDIYACADPCLSLVGWYWDGSFCRSIACCCEGPDCGEIYSTSEACFAARATCELNACAQVNGYCEYGDYTEPTCAPDYGKDSWIAWEYPGVCGLGVCCAPCPNENHADVSYISHEVNGCADLDWDCFGENLRPFENECGCGCAPVPVLE